MRLWRISQYPGLSGYGGTLVSGRWHNAGPVVIYSAEHPALAMIEALAHMQLKLSSMPTTLKLLAIDVKEGAQIAELPALPSGWQANQPTTQTIGSAWLAEASALLLKVPSAVLPESWNYLINPRAAHAATHLSETQLGPIWIDPRLVR